MQFKTHRCTIDSWNIKFSFRSSHVAAKLACQLWSSEFAAQLFLSATAKPCPVSVHKKTQRKSPFSFSATILTPNADTGEAVSVCCSQLFQDTSKSFSV